MEQARKILRVPTTKFTFAVLLMIGFTLIVGRSAGFAQAFAQYAAGGWSAMHGDADYGGQGLPPSWSMFLSSRGDTVRDVMAARYGNEIAGNYSLVPNTALR